MPRCQRDVILHEQLGDIGKFASVELNDAAELTERSDTVRRCGWY